MNIHSILSQKMNMPDVRDIVAWTQTSANHHAFLWDCTRSEDRRVAVNALWVLTHLPETDAGWLRSRQDEIADMLLTESDSSKKRLLLQLLKAQEFDPDALRSDLLDFCLSKINAEDEPYAIRCFSLYVAFLMCRHYPELILELKQYLDFLGTQSLSPGLRSAHRQVCAKIARLEKMV